jgi:hypothetical protein
LSAILILFALISGCAPGQEVIEEPGYNLVSARSKEIPQVPVFWVTAIVKVGDYSSTVKLLVDSGADCSVISPDIMRGMITIPQDAKGDPVSGVTGNATAIRAWIDSIEVDGVKGGPFVIALFKIPPLFDGMDGVLGRDFLYKLKGMTFDREKGKVTFF